MSPSTIAETISPTYTSSLSHSLTYDTHLLHPLFEFLLKLTAIHVSCLTTISVSYVDYVILSYLILFECYLLLIFDIYIFFFAAKYNADASIACHQPGCRENVATQVFVTLFRLSNILMYCLIWHSCYFADYGSSSLPTICYSRGILIFFFLTQFFRNLRFIHKFEILNYVASLYRNASGKLKSSQDCDVGLLKSCKWKTKIMRRLHLVVLFVAALKLEKVEFFYFCSFF